MKYDGISARIPALVVAAALAASGASRGAPSSQRVQVAVIGSKLRLPGTAVGNYYAAKMARGSTAASAFAGVDAIDVSPSTLPNFILIELVDHDRTVSRINGKLLCSQNSSDTDPEAPPYAVVSLSLTDLGFGLTTPILVLPSRELRIGPVRSKTAGCIAIGTMPSLRKAGGPVVPVPPSPFDAAQTLLADAEIQSAVLQAEKEIADLKTAVLAERGGGPKPPPSQRISCANNLKQIGQSVHRQAQSLEALRQQKNNAKAVEASQALARAGQALAAAADAFPKAPGPGDREALARLSAAVDELKKSAERMTEQTRRKP